MTHLNVTVSGKALFSAKEKKQLAKGISLDQQLRRQIIILKTVTFSVIGVLVVITALFGKL